MALPLESAIQEGRLLGEASRLASPSRLILIGVWLIAVPHLLVFGVLWSDGLERGRRDLVWLLGGLGALLWCLLLALVAFRTTVHWRQAHRARATTPPTLGE
jgi:ABC-type cobalamin transport system permease subunit